jgi:hypothetical protein
MYRVSGCVVVWGFALFGFKEWYERTYETDSYRSDA